MDESGQPTIAALARKIAERFSLAELRALCSDLGVPFEDLEGDTLTTKALALVEYLARRGRVGELVARCRELRSNVKWEDIDSGPQGTKVDEPLNPPKVPDRAKRSLEILRDPVWDGIGAIVAIVACVVAALLIPPIQAWLWPAAAPSLTPTWSATPTWAASPTIAPSPTGTPTPTLTPPPSTPSPTPAPTCPYQASSDHDTLTSLVKAEAQAVNKGIHGGIEIIQLIFAPTAVISNAIETREWWTNPVDRYIKLFAGTSYTEVEHFDIRLVGLDTKGNIAYLTSGSRGFWRTGSGSWTPYTNTSHLNAATPFGSDHWTFGKDGSGCWVITRFVFNAGHVPFPP